MLASRLGFSRSCIVALVVATAGLPTRSENVAANEFTRRDSSAASLMAFCGVSRAVVPVVPVVPVELVELVELVEHPAINTKAPAHRATAAARRWPLLPLRGEWTESGVMTAG
jgi:hypothetical protein